MFSEKYENTSYDVISGTFPVYTDRNYRTSPYVDKVLRTVLISMGGLCPMLYLPFDEVKGCYLGNFQKGLCKGPPHEVCIL